MFSLGQKPDIEHLSISFIKPIIPVMVYKSSSSFSRKLRSHNTIFSLGPKPDIEHQGIRGHNHNSLSSSQLTYGSNKLVFFYLQSFLALCTVTLSLSAHS
jgi:hypothetical protein